MPYASNIHVAVYQVLDQVMRDPVPPPGAKAAIHSIIDDLRDARAPRDMLESTEQISLQLHALESALFAGNGGQAEDARRSLRAIAGAWLNFRIVH